MDYIVQRIAKSWDTTERLSLAIIGKIPRKQLKTND